MNRLDAPCPAGALDAAEVIARRDGEARLTQAEAANFLQRHFGNLDRLEMKLVHEILCDCEDEHTHYTEVQDGDVESEAEILSHIMAFDDWRLWFMPRMEGQTG
jgi:hypothetical protein